ncbi:MAG: dockerin type I repeat-containing protein [Planctomycetota bacterium]
MATALRSDIGGEEAGHVYYYANTPPGVGCDSNFIRGDCNGDGTKNIADAVFTLSFLFPLGAPPTFSCEDACDANDDGAINIADPIALLGSLFGAPTVPLPPPVFCDVDPTPDGLTCTMPPPICP